MSTKKNILFLFTDSFPCAKSETYLESEIDIIATSFKKIYIFPINITSDVRRIPLNCEIVDLHQKIKIKRLLFLVLAINEWFSAFFVSHNRFGFFVNALSHLKKMYNAIAYQYAISDFILKENLERTEIVAYSYWFYHWSLICSLLKKNKLVMKAISRAHLNDLYIHLFNQDFTGYKLKYLNKVYSISIHGQKHLQNLYPKFNNKIGQSYLGVKHKGENPHKVNSLPFVMVSCSYVRKDKRVDKIAEIISYLNFEIHWYHFGNGPEFEKLQNSVKTLPKNIKVFLKGYCPNSEVMTFYKTQAIDLFLNVSSAEGVPVSIMEAISFGIPVLATNVYGTPEVANDLTGILIDENFDSKEVAEKIKLFFEKKQNDDRLKKRIIDFWKSRFSAESNYIEFVNNINNPRGR